MKQAKKIQKIPSFLQSALWSYDLSKMDPKDKSDKRIIIEQVLNYGTWEQVKWVIKNYTWEEIEEIVENPSRGIWMDKSLYYWTRFFKIKLSPERYDASIMRLDPIFKKNALRNS